MMADKYSTHTGMSKNNFPKTTNQDFHSDAVFTKAVVFGPNVDKQNFKRQNPYAAYVNA